MIDNATCVDTSENNSRSPIRKISPSHEMQGDGVKNNPTLLGQNLDRLPEELLSEIFCLCLSKIFCSVKPTKGTALVISQVSRKWRRIALRTPRLWGLLYLTIQGTGVDCLTKPINLLELWTSRARDCALTVHIKFKENIREPIPDNVIVYVNTIIGTLQRLRPALSSREMKLCASIDASGNSEPGADTFPLVLEHYSWANMVERPDRPGQGSIQVYVSRYASILYALEGHAVLGSHLVHLDLRDPHCAIWLALEEARTALSIFSQLQYCALRLGYNDDHDVPDIVDLPQLLHLVLIWSEGVEAGRLLSGLTTPQLHHLELSGPLPSSQTLPGEKWECLLAFLRKCQPPLFGLELRWMDASMIDLTSCLAACGMLTHLTLMDCTVGGGLIEKWRIAQYRRFDAMWRTVLRLQYLALVGCEIENIDTLLLLLASDSSFWQESQLEELLIIGCNVSSNIAVEIENKLPILVEISDEREED